MSRAVLRSRFISMDSRLTVVDFGFNEVADLTDRLIVEGSYVKRDSTGQIPGTASFQLQSIEGIDFGRHLLRLDVTVNDETTGVAPP